MDRSLKWRTLALLVGLLLCVGVLAPTWPGTASLPSWFPFKKKISLGLDLQGGMHIVYSIDLDKAVDDKASELKRDLEPLIRVGKALKIGRMEPAAGDVLRELSRMELLGPDLFVIGSDRQVWSTCWDAKGWNADWFQVSAQPVPVFDATQQQVTAVSREPGNLELFVLGSDSRAWMTSGSIS